MQPSRKPRAPPECVGKYTQADDLQQAKIGIGAEKEEPGIRRYAPGGGGGSVKRSQLLLERRILNIQIMDETK